MRFLPAGGPVQQIAAPRTGVPDGARASLPPFTPAFVPGRREGLR